MGLLIVSILAVLLVAANVLLDGRIQGFVGDTASLAWGSLGSAASAFDRSGAFSSRQSLAQENIDLRAKIASLEALGTANQALMDQNAALAAAANLHVASSSSITVPVLSRPDTSPYGTIVITAGSAEGINAGSSVYAEGGVLLGTVADVGAHSALVRILLSPGVKTDARIGTSTDTTVTGRGGGNGIAQVPRDTEVAVGDPVYAADFHSILGVVGAIDSSPSDAEQTVYLRVPVNLFGLRYVSIVPKQD